MIATSPPSGGNTRPSFDPATGKRRFVVAGKDHSAFLLAPKLLPLLNQTAPGVSVEFVDLSDQLLDQFSAREVDFAIIASFYLEDLPSAPLHYRPLFRDYAVALFREGHPLSHLDKIGLQDFRAYRMVGFHPASDIIEKKRSASHLDQESLNVIANVPQVTLSPFLLMENDYFTFVSRRIAEQLTRILPLQSRELDFPTPHFDIGLVWSQIQDADPAHRWFREQVCNIAAA